MATTADAPPNNETATTAEAPPNEAVARTAEAPADEPMTADAADEGPALGKRFQLSALFTFSNLTQTEIQEVPVGQLPVPQRIIVRELDLVPRPVGSLVYVNAARAHQIGAGMVDVANMIQSIREGTYAPQPDATLYYRPLDLNLRVPTCFIIKLSDKWNWRFSHKAKAATLGPNAVEENYFNLRHVKSDNIGQANYFQHPEFCRLIYFVATPVFDGGGQVANFDHAFNLNIEFVYPDGPTGANTIPLLVDPDIRHPGGTE